MADWEWEVPDRSGRYHACAGQLYERKRKREEARAPGSGYLALYSSTCVPRWLQLSKRFVCTRRTQRAESNPVPVLPRTPLSKLAAVRCRLAFGLALASEPPPARAPAGGPVLDTERHTSPAALLDVDVMPLVLRAVRVVPKLCNRTIRQAWSEWSRAPVRRSTEYGTPYSSTSGVRTYVRPYSVDPCPVAEAKWGHIADWDVSSVVNMSRLFSGAQDFDEDIGDWDVRAVRDMTSMFSCATNFNQDLSRWAP